MIATTSSLTPAIDWASSGSHGWQPGLPTVDITLLATNVPGGFYLKLDADIGGQPIEVKSGQIAVISSKDEPQLSEMV